MLSRTLIGLELKLERLALDTSLNFPKGLLANLWDRSLALQTSELQRAYLAISVLYNYLTGLIYPPHVVVPI